MRRKGILAMFLTFGMLLSACGGNQVAVTDGTESVPMEDSVQQNAEEQTGETLPSGKVELKVWGAEEDQALLAEMVESFKQEYAGQADFEITLEVQGESDSRDKLLGNLDNAADVFAFADDQLMSMVAAGVLEPIANADEIASRNVEGAVAAATVNEKLYAYPMTADNGYFLYYNKAYFSDEDVKTLDGILAVAAANGKKFSMEMTSGWYLYSFFGQTGLTVGLNDDGISNYCTWNATDGNIKGVDVAQALLDISTNPGFANNLDDDFVAGVKDGSIIAGVSGVWNSTTIEEVWGENYGATKLPTYTCAGQQIQMSSFTGYKMIGANAYSKYPEWASKLADWITNEQNQTLRFKERGQGPSNINAAENPEVAKSLAIQAVLQQAEYGSLQRIGGNYWTPVCDFGTEIANGNPSGKDLQVLLDNMVEEVTASNSVN